MNYSLHSDSDMTSQNKDSQTPERFRTLPAPKRFAVLLNARAKAWTGTVHEDVLKFIPSRDLFLTDDFRQAEQTVEKLLSGGYDAIFTGGGDGTIVYLLNAIERHIRAGKIRREDAPPVGVLRLGTGNALASYVGAGSVLDDLRALRAGAPLKVQQINMLCDESARLFPFAGFGWDADILNDYDALKKSVRDTALENYVTGEAGYGLSIALRTIPKAIFGKTNTMRFTNMDDVAYRLNEHGEVVDEFARGDVLYEGPCNIVSGASIPYWGFKVRMFPFCNLKPGFFELRCYHGRIAPLVANLPRFWKGDISPASLSDFLVSSVRIESLGEPMAYHIAGDAEGMQQAVQWHLYEHPCHLAAPLK